MAILTGVYVVRVLQGLLGRLDLSPPHISDGEEHLSVDVGRRHGVIVHQNQLTHTKTTAVGFNFFLKHSIVLLKYKSDKLRQVL